MTLVFYVFLPSLSDRERTAHRFFRWLSFYLVCSSTTRWAQHILNKDWSWHLVWIYFYLNFIYFMFFPLDQFALCIMPIYSVLWVLDFSALKFFLLCRWVALMKLHLTASLLSLKWLSIYVSGLLGEGLLLLSLGSSLQSLFGFWG